MKRFILVLAALLIVPVVAEAKIEFLESNIEVNSTKTEFFIGIIFDQPPTGTMEYPLLYRIENFGFGGNIRGVKCEAQRKPWGTNIACDFAGAQGPGRTLELKYETADLVKIVENQRLFSTTVRAPQDTDRLVVRAYLAPGFVLVDPDKGPLPPFTPVNGVSGSDGRRIYVVWSQNATAKGEGLDVTIAYERILPQTGGELPLLLIMGFVGLVLALIVIVLIKRRREEKATATPITILKEDERKIVEFLQSQGGVAKQRALVTHTGFSKAKVSRLVRDLQVRKVLAVKGMGRTNEVKLLITVSQKAKEEPRQAKTPDFETKPPTEGPKNEKDGQEPPQ